MNNFTDGEFESKLLIRDPSGQAREIGFTTFQKVPDKRLVRFSSPGDLKGMGVLVENKDTMYVFLPGFQKVRRVGTHVKNQTFMGSDFSYEDMSLSRYSPTYDAKLVKEDAKPVGARAHRQGGAGDRVPARAHGGREEVEPADQDRLHGCRRQGAQDLRVRRLSHRRRATTTVPTKVVVTDHRRNDHKSEIVFTRVKLNQGLKDDFFTQRTLIRGH